jgi:hypothetical protein
MTDASRIATVAIAQFKRIDIAMVAAAIVEVPRWYVAFAAIKEPWWAAVPMGILLAWGASAGWKAYFADRRRWLLLAINVTSLAGALIVIAPVLYAMTFTPLDEINLALVMSQELLMAWAATLAITTFIPLVQIAAVKMYASSAAPDPAQDATPTVQRRNVEPEVVQDATPEPLQVAQDAADDATPTVDARAQALQMANEGMNASQIARALDANYSTVRSWLKRAQVQHTNGVSHE